MAHWKQAIQKLKQFRRELPTIVANEMVNYALDNLRAQAFLGVSWAPRKSSAPRNAGRRLLIDTGDGERSIRIDKKTSREISITANEYMSAHNTGAKINKAVSVRNHSRKRKGRTETVKAHTRNMNITLPKRTFFATGPEFGRRIVNVLGVRFKQLI